MLYVPRLTDHGLAIPTVLPSASLDFTSGSQLTLAMVNVVHGRHALRCGLVVLQDRNLGGGLELWRWGHGVLSSESGGKGGFRWGGGLPVPSWNSLFMVDNTKLCCLRGGD